MSVQPKAPPGPGHKRPPWWRQILAAIGALLILLAFASVALLGLYAVNMQIADVVGAWRNG